MTESAYGMVAGFLIFLAGTVLGAAFVTYGFKFGAKLTDRFTHDLAPFDEDFVEDDVQTRTDGTMMSEEEV